MRACAGASLASLIFGGDDGIEIGPSGIIGSIIGAIIVLLIYNAVTGRKRTATLR